MKFISGVWQESVQLMQGKCQCASISGCSNYPNRHLCLPLFSCFGREDPAPSSSLCTHSGEQERKLFPAAHLCGACGLKMWFGEKLSPPCSCLVPEETVLLPFPCAQHCALLTPSSQVASLILAAEQILLMNLAEICDFFSPFFFLGLVYCQLSGLLNQVSTFPATKDLFFWHS